MLFVNAFLSIAELLLDGGACLNIERRSGGLQAKCHDAVQMWSFYSLCCVNEEQERMWPLYCLEPCANQDYAARIIFAQLFTFPDCLHRESP
jgi:hypothetical protein